MVGDAADNDPWRFEVSDERCQVGMYARANCLV
jgi:hypothetical protein